MTEQSFDRLLAAGLARALEDDLELAWAAQGPDREVSPTRKRPVRRTVRLSLLAALIAALTLGACAAAVLVPSLREYWEFDAKQYVLGPAEILADFSVFTFDCDTLFLDWDIQLGDVSAIGPWYPAWLPETYGKEGEELSLIREDWDSGFCSGGLEYNVLCSDGRTLGGRGFTVNYTQFNDPDDTFRMEMSTEGELLWEEATVGQYPACLLRDAGAGWEYLFWFNTDRMTLFRMEYYSGELDDAAAIRIAKSFKEEIKDFGWDKVKD